MFVLAADLDPESSSHSHKVRMLPRAGFLDCIWSSLGLHDYRSALLMAARILTGTLYATVYGLGVQFGTSMTIAKSSIKVQNTFTTNGDRRTKKDSSIPLSVSAAQANDGQTLNFDI